MEKKLIVEFNFGEIYEFEAKKISKTILVSRNMDVNNEDYINNLLINQPLFIESVKKLPWVELMPHVSEICKTKPYCLCNEWRKGNVKIITNW